MPGRSQSLCKHPGDTSQWHQRRHKSPDQVSPAPKGFGKGTRGALAGKSQGHNQEWHFEWVGKGLGSNDVSNPHVAFTRDCLSQQGAVWHWGCCRFGGVNWESSAGSQAPQDHIKNNPLARVNSRKLYSNGIVPSKETQKPANTKREETGRVSGVVLVQHQWHVGPWTCSQR